MFTQLTEREKHKTLLHGVVKVVESVILKLREYLKIWWCECDTELWAPLDILRLSFIRLSFIRLSRTRLLEWWTFIYIQTRHKILPDTGMTSSPVFLEKIPHFSAVCRALVVGYWWHLAALMVGFWMSKFWLEISYNLSSDQGHWCCTFNVQHWTSHSMWIFSGVLG